MAFVLSYLYIIIYLLPLRNYLLIKLLPKETDTRQNVYRFVKMASTCNVSSSVLE